MRNFNNLSKIVSVAVILLTAFAFEVFAAPSTTQYPTQRKAQTPQEKRQQLQQESTTALSELTTRYQEILGYVNSSQIPPAQNLETALKAVAKNRKYLLVFDNLQKSTYHIFSAWVYYFDNKSDKAIKEAVSGQKAFPENLNTVKTRFALSVINKDYPAALDTLTTPIVNNRPAARPPANTESQSSQTPTDDIRLDVNAVKIELFSKTFDIHPEPVEANSTSLWRPTGRLVCTLLWKMDANGLDHFAPPVVKAKKIKSAADANEPNEPKLPVNPEPQPSEEQARSWQPARELGELSQLQDLFGKDKRVVFATINLNNSEKRKNLANWLAKYPQAFQTFLLSAEQHQKAVSLIGDSNTPTLLVVGPDSTIRYAGDANGFLPKMIIYNILRDPLEFASVDTNEPNLPPVVSQPNLPAVESAPPVQPPVEPNVTTQALTDDIKKNDVNTQKPKTDVNTVSAPATPQKADDGFSAADDYQAEKLLSNARSFLQIGNKLPSHMYRDPVEMCRQVMKSYPNTKYAQEAQMLLRNVPKENREQYNITDQELGL